MFPEILLSLLSVFETNNFMAATLLLGPEREDGLAPIFLRVQDFKSGLQIKQKTGLLIAPSVWEKRNDDKALDKFMKIPELARTLNACTEIRRSINAQFEEGRLMTKDEVRELTRSIVYRDEKKAEEEAAAAKAAAEAEANRMTLAKYIDMYISQIKSGARMTDKSRKYAPSTIRSIVTAMNQWKAFQKKVKKVYDFDDIDMQCYYDYTSFLMNKTKVVDGKQVFDGYSINSVGKCVKELKAILYTAQIEGYHHNDLWKDKKFKGTRIEVDNVYLTREELDKIMALKYEGIHSGHGIARDIFMVGVWTAQRVSDYNNLSKDSIHTYTKRTIADVPDPENPGKTKPVVVEKDITYIDIKQQKTGAQVAIPCSSQLLEILKKYDFQMPHLEDQVINRYLKEICKDAGIDQLVQIEVTNGGTPKKVWKPKYELVHTHTARRTGATLMYLSGMDIYDIMKITGHTSPAMLRKYIKAENLTVVEKITDKYDYFD